MEIRRLFHAVIRKLWLIILLPVLFAGIAYYLTIAKYQAIYGAKTSLYITNQNGTSLTGQTFTYSDLIMGKQFVQDYSELIHSRRVLSAVVKDLNNPRISESMINSSINVYLNSDSNVMSISAYWTDPKTAAAVSNSVSKAFIAELKDLTDIINIGIVDEAQPPNYPMPANNTKNVMVGLLAGLAIAFGIIYVLNLFDTTIRSAEDIEKCTGFKVMGIIPEHDIH